MEPDLRVASRSSRAVTLMRRWPGWMLAALLLVAVAERTRPVGWFVVNQLQLDYQFEFVRRGLPGELLRVVGIPRTPDTSAWLSWMVAGLLAVVAFAFFSRMLAVRGTGATTAAATPLMLAFLLSPATFLQAGYDFGRLDAMLIAITMIVLLTYDGGWEAALLDVVLVAGATLSHEIFIVTSAPLIVVAFLVIAMHQPALRRRLLVRAALFSLVTVVAGLAVIRYGNMETFTFEQYAALLASQGRLGGNDPTAIAVAFRTLGDSIAYAATRYASKPLFPAAVAMGVAVATWAAVWRAMPRRSELTAVLLAVAAGTPLLLVPIGHDYGRWLAMSMANALVVLALASHLAGPPPNPRIAWLSLIALAGPLGANIVVPWWG